MQGKIDSTKLQRGLVSFLLVISAVAVSSYGIRANKAIIYWMVVAFPVMVYFVKDPRSLVIFAIMAKLAWLVTPGFSQHTTSPFNLAAIALFASSSAMIAMKKLSPGKGDPSVKWLVFFIVVVVFTMAVRGTGLAMLGSSSWGGGRYIILMLLFLFFFSLRRFEYERAHVRWLIWGSIGATGLLAFGQWLFVYTGGSSFGLTNFMDIQADYVAGSEMTGMEFSLSRFTHLRWLSYALMPLAFFWPKKMFLSFSIVGVSLFMMFLTGFRSEVASLGVVYLGTGIAFSKNKVRFLFSHALVAVVGYAVLLVLVPVLPETILRSVSFLPGVQVSGVVEDVAVRSITWRLEVWEYCAKAVPKHLLIGRGLIFEVMEWAWLSRSVYGTPEFFYATHAYHSGPFSLLLDFGIFGFVTMSGFFITTCIHLVREVRSFSDQHSIYYKFAVYMVVMYIWLVVKFYLIYGDLGVYLGRMFIIYSIGYVAINYLKRSCAESGGVQKALLNNV